VITTERPGRKLAGAVTEIQQVIDNITGADGGSDWESGGDIDVTEVNVITGVRIANNQLQIKTQTITIKKCEYITRIEADIESEWTMADGGQGVECDT